MSMSRLEAERERISLFSAEKQREGEELYRSFAGAVASPISTPVGDPVAGEQRLDVVISSPSSPGQ